MNLITRLLFGLTFVFTSLVVIVYSITYHPKPLEPITTDCPTDTPKYDPSKPLKVLSYNVQFFAGKNYIFYFDIPDNKGPDNRPSQQHIASTIDGIANLIRREQPDVLLLQEVHENAKATDHEDQLIQLQQALANAAFPCHSSALYWQADFVPHPKILGSVGMKLSTLSRYALGPSVRHQLALPPMDIVSQQFNLKRAILQTSLLTTNGDNWQILNTHFDAFTQGSDTMTKQVAYTHNLLNSLESIQSTWIMGGDFNLLPMGAYAELAADQQYLYQPVTELEPILKAYPSIPSIEMMNSPQKENWFTHWPNDQQVTGPDRTIDYLFHSPTLTSKSAYVINKKDALTLSDHYPVVASFKQNQP